MYRGDAGFVTWRSSSFIHYVPLNFLDFDTVNMFLKSKEIPEAELDLVEPWFKTKYSENLIPPAWQTACKVRRFCSKILDLKDFRIFF